MLQSTMINVVRIRLQKFGLATAFLWMMGGDFNAKLARDDTHVGPVSNELGNLRGDALKTMMIQFDLSAINSMKPDDNYLSTIFNESVRDQHLGDWTLGWTTGAKFATAKELKKVAKARQLIQAGDDIDEYVLAVPDGPLEPPPCATHCDWNKKGFQQIDYVMSNRDYPGTTSSFRCASLACSKASDHVPTLIARRLAKDAELKKKHFEPGNKFMPQREKQKLQKFPRKRLKKPPEVVKAMNKVAEDGFEWYIDKIRKEIPLSKKWVPNKMFQEVLQESNLDEVDTLEDFSDNLRIAARQGGGPMWKQWDKHDPLNLLQQWQEQIREFEELMSRASKDGEGWTRDNVGYIRQYATKMIWKLKKWIQRRRTDLKVRRWAETKQWGWKNRHTTTMHS